MERLNALFFFRRGGLWYNIQRFFYLKEGLS